MFFGHLTEELSRPESPTTWKQPLPTRLQAHVLGYIPMLAAWFVIVTTFIGASTLEFKDEDNNVRKMPDFVYAIVATQAVLFWSFSFVQLVVVIREPQHYAIGELAYQVLSLVSKGLLGIMIIANVLVLGN
jgi:hypothetical protein